VRGVDGLDRSGLGLGHPGWKVERPAVGLPDQKMKANIVLDRSDNIHCLPKQRVKRIVDHRIKSRNPGIMTLLPMKAAGTGPASPACHSSGKQRPALFSDPPHPAR